MKIRWFVIDFGRLITDWLTDWLTSIGIAANVHNMWFAFCHMRTHARTYNNNINHEKSIRLPLMLCISFYVFISHGIVIGSMNEQPISLLCFCLMLCYQQNCLLVCKSCTQVNFSVWASHFAMWTKMLSATEMPFKLCESTYEHTLLLF